MSAGLRSALSYPHSVDIVAIAGTAGDTSSSVHGLLVLASAHVQVLAEDLPDPLTWASAPTTWVFDPVPVLAIVIATRVSSRPGARVRDPVPASYGEPDSA